MYQRGPAVYEVVKKYLENNVFADVFEMNESLKLDISPFFFDWTFYFI